MAIYRGPHGQVSRQPEPCSSAMLDQKGRAVCCVSCSLWIHTCFLSLRCYGSKTVTIFLYLDISKTSKFYEDLVRIIVFYPSRMRLLHGFNVL